MDCLYVERSVDVVGGIQKAVMVKVGGCILLERLGCGYLVVRASPPMGRHMTGDRHQRLL